jgi:hypothetical protein
MRLPSRHLWGFEFKSAVPYFVGAIPVIAYRLWATPDYVGAHMSADMYFLIGIVGGTVMRVLRPRKPSLIKTAPGHRILSVVSWLYARQTVARVFAPTIYDMQHEHIEALAEGQVWKARWVVLRGDWSVLSAMIAQAPLSLLKRLFELWKAAS